MKSNDKTSVLNYKSTIVREKDLEEISVLPFICLQRVFKNKAAKKWLIVMGILLENMLWKCPKKYG